MELPSLDKIMPLVNKYHIEKGYIISVGPEPANIGFVFDVQYHGPNPEEISFKVAITGMSSYEEYQNFCKFIGYPLDTPEIGKPTDFYYRITAE